jgi:hypothetical protein
LAGAGQTEPVLEPALGGRAGGDAPVQQRGSFLEPDEAGVGAGQLRGRAGVAGGALLFQGLNEVFGGHEGAASEAHHAVEEPGGWDDGGQW